MRPGDRYPGGPELADTQGAALPARHLERRAGQEDRGVRPAARRWGAAAAWAGGSLALFAFLLRISLGSRVNSDGANNALQAWDMLHGHVLLHGWLIGDATFYFFELPLNAITELLFGMGNLAAHVASALTYLIVAVCAVALAVTDSRGPARAARCAVVVTVLAAPLFTTSSVGLLLEEPDHTGTSAFLLASFLLIDRAPGRRFTAPLLCVILCAGQLSDLTVRYVAVPAVLLVCGYRVLAGRRLRCGDAALVVAAAASVPLESLIRAAMRHLGAYLMAAPGARLSPMRLWPHHAAVTWLNVRILFGSAGAPHTRLGSVGAAFGLACLLAAVFGLGRVAWTWRAARRAEQLLCVAIAVNIGVFLVSVFPSAIASHEIAAVLPCGAVLAARACVPARITGTPQAFLAVTATALAALVPLAAAATRPPLRPATAPLAAWLKAHGLTYGIAGYWDASVVTMQSGDRVQIRAVDIRNKKIFVPYWETNALWYHASRYDARFVVADDHLGRYPAAAFEQHFGRPVATHRVASWLVLIYRTNLLQQLANYPGQLVPARASPPSYFELKPRDQGPGQLIPRCRPGKRTSFRDTSRRDKYGHAGNSGYSSRYRENGLNSGVR
jgi:hypothetical protein